MGVGVDRGCWKSLATAVPGLKTSQPKREVGHQSTNLVELWRGFRLFAMLQLFRLYSTFPSVRFFCLSSIPLRSRIGVRRAWLREV